MQIRTYRTDCGVTVAIDPYSEAPAPCRDKITVHKVRELGAKEWRHAEVNWSAIGSVSVEETEQFAKAMLRAVAIAKKLDQHPELDFGD